MLPTKTPQLLKRLYPSLIWDKPPEENGIYLTFDDGPHPDITPWVMDELERHNYKATFFCIGDNVKKFPETYDQILKRGHGVGNHTFNHLKGFRTDNTTYYHNISLCQEHVNSQLFRPPYGYIKRSQIRYLKSLYSIIMWSLLAEDWNPKLNIALKLDLLSRHSKKGDIIVFHDSVKAEKNLKILLPLYLQYLSEKKFNSLLF